MRLIYAFLILLALILAPVAPARAYTLQYTSTAATTQVKWPTTNITGIFSSWASRILAPIFSGRVSRVARKFSASRRERTCCA